MERIFQHLERIIQDLERVFQLLERVIQDLEGLKYKGKRLKDEVDLRLKIWTGQVASDDPR